MNTTMRKIISRAALVVAVSLLGALFVVPRIAVPTIDLSTPGAIENAAVSGKLTTFMKQLGGVAGEGSEYSPIKGDSITKGHENEIEISSVAFAIDRDGADDATVQPLLVTKHLDRATALLQQMVFKNKHFGQLTISFWGSVAGAERIVLEYVMNQAMPVAFTSGVGDAANDETLKLAFGDIERIYHPYTSKGLPLTTIDECWNVVNSNGLGCGSS